MTKPKNPECDKTQELKMWQNSKTLIVTKLKTQIVTKLKNLSCDKTQKLKLWQNSKNQIVTKLKNSNCDCSNSDSSDSNS